MKKNLTHLLLFQLIVIPLLTKSQNIFNGERIQIVGAFQNYTTTPYGTDYRTTTYRQLSVTTGTPTDGRGQWTSTINVKNTGGDVTPTNMVGGSGNGFLFISGPIATPYQNKWVFGGVGQAALNSINDLIYNGSTDMGLNMSNEGFYTFAMNDCGYNTNVNAKFYVARTTNAPIAVTRTNEVVNQDGSVTVNITTSGLKSAEENILIRYVSGIASDFSGTTATTVIQATGTGTNFVATIPAPNTSTSIKYYIFTSSISAVNLNAQSEINKSLATLRFDDNNGLNYTTAITLPVQLSFFRASKQNNCIELQWKTNTEKNVEKFEVEKLDSKWEKIGSVDAVNSFTGSVYNFKDFKETETNIYRLKIIDKNGVVNYSSTIQVQLRNTTHNLVQIFPNIVKNKNIQIVLAQKSAGKIKINVVDEFGRRLAAQEMNGIVGINNIAYSLPTNIVKGRYYIQIQTPSFNKTASIIVQ